MAKTYLRTGELKRMLRAHRSLQFETNPVGMKLKAGGDTAWARAVLGQYSFLPRRIVELLGLAVRGMVGGWPEVEKELKRNIGEELGKETAGISHFNILKRCFKEELRLDVDTVPLGEGTSSFLCQVSEALRKDSRAHIAGVVCALEDSAILELEVVAKIINSYAELAGHRSLPIQLAALRNKSRLPQIRQRDAGNLSLEDFFVLHLLVFEQLHSSELYKTVAPYILSESDFNDLVTAYEWTLGQMDLWWTALADLDSKEFLEEGRTLPRSRGWR